MWRKILASLLLFASIIVIPAYADSSTPAISRQGWGVDNTLLSGKNSVYIASTAIDIENIQTTDPTMLASPSAYIAGLSYYLAAFYHEDLPYTYLIDWQGHEYEGARGGIGVETRTDKPTSIYIGYMGGNILTPAAATTLQGLVENINGETGVSHIVTSTLGFQKGIISTEAASTSWSDSVGLAMKTISFVYTSPPPVKIAVTSTSILPAKDGNIDIYVSFENKAATLLYGKIYVGSETETPVSLPTIWLSTERSSATELADITEGKDASVTAEVISRYTKGQYGLNLYTDTGLIKGSAMVLSYTGQNTAPSIKSIQSVTIKGSGQTNVMTGFTTTATVAGSVTGGKSYTVDAATNVGSTLWYEILYNGKQDAWIQASMTS